MPVVAGGRDLGQHALARRAREARADRHLERAVAERRVGDPRRLHRTASATVLSHAPVSAERSIASSTCAVATISAEPGRALLAVADRGEQVRRLEHAQVVVAHRHAGARLEGREARMLRAGEHASCTPRRRRRRAAEALAARSCARAPSTARRACRAPRSRRLRRAGRRHAAGLERADRAAARTRPARAAQSSFSTSTSSSVSTRVKCVPSPIGCGGRRGIIVAVRPLRRSIGPTRKCVRSTTWAIRSPSAPEPASARKKRHEAAESGRFA